MSGKIRRFLAFLLTIMLCSLICVQNFLSINVAASNKSSKSVVEKYYPELKELADKGIISIEVDVKEYLTFGRYDMEYKVPMGSWDWNYHVSDGKKEDIVWQVLDYSDDGKSALVISKYAICNRCYDENQERTPSWKTSSLRKWLNGDFYNSAFNKKEQSMIKKVKLDNLSGECWNRSVSSESTDDKVFILSPDEVYNKYYTDDTERVAFYSNGEIVDYWWQRWNGGPNSSPLVDIVGGEGAGDYWLGYDGIGVRPAMWIELSKDMIKKYNLSCGKTEKEYYPQATKNDVYVVMGTNKIHIYYEDYEKPIRWKILKYDSENGKALLLSEQLIGSDSFNENGGKTWEKSTLRKWLNGYFYKNSFTTTERKLIKKVKIKNANNPEYGTDSGKNTKDRIFLLSASEANKYLKQGTAKNPQTDRLAATRYGSLSGWWLRTAGYDKENVAIMDYYGSIDYYGERADCIYPVTEGYEYDGVRPAMWIKLN